MEDTGVHTESFIGEKQARLPYHSPVLMSLGQIQAIVQSCCTLGSDGMGGPDCHS
jgi:hypothetical protein